MSPPRKHKPGYTRSRTGCLTCRKRHVKCIETRPERPECFRLHLTCEWITAASPANSLNRTHVSPHPTPTKATDRSGLSQGSDDGSTEVGVIGYDVGHIRSGDYGDSGGEGTVLPICTTYDFSPPQLEAMYENRNHHDGFIISSSSTQELPSGCKNPADPNFPVQHPTLLELKTIDEEFEQLFGKLADTPVQVSATADMPTGGGSVLGEEVIGGFTENWGTNSVV